MGRGETPGPLIFLRGSMFEEDEDSSRPRLVGIEYNYFGDGELTIDEDVVRRVRTEFDRQFVPVFKRMVFQYPTGGQKVFRHFGAGIGHLPGMPIFNKPVYSALKPVSGYLSTLERAMLVGQWWERSKPNDQVEPGETVPFGEWVYGYARDCDNNVRRLAASGPSGDGNALPGVQDELRQIAYKATLAALQEQQDSAQKAKSAEADPLRYVIRDEKKHFRTLFEMTDDERMALAALQGDPNPTNAVNFVPSKPGSLIIVPN
jgi:hypothetical protein